MSGRQLSRRLTLRQLEVFVEAARVLNFSEVAERLHLTQPAISMQIRQLEEAVGLPLFERAGRHKTLTEAGLLLRHHAARMLAELQDAEQRLLSLRGLTGGTINIGLVSTTKYFAPGLLARFLREHPGVDVGFMFGNREMLVRLLMENQIDLALMGRPPAEVETLAEPLAENPHVLVAPLDHPFVSAHNIDMHALRDDTFLMREPGSGTRLMLEELFRSHLFKPARLVTLGSNETVKQAVMAGLGVSLLSLHTLSLELRSRQIAVLDVLGLPMQRVWHVVQLRRRQLSPLAEAFRHFLIQETQAFLSQTQMRLPRLSPRRGVAGKR